MPVPSLEEAKKTGTEEARPLYYREVSIHIDAPPELVYELISQVTRMGEWSPECYRTEWVKGYDRPEVGARFKGYNKYRGFRWARTSQIEVAEPGKEFAFRTIPAFLYRDSTLWRYVLKSANGGTDVTESFAVSFAAFNIRLIEEKTSRQDDTQRNMLRTLERLKAHAEALVRAG